MKTLNIWVVGAGEMAFDYHKVLSSIGAKFKFIGRGERSARRMEKRAGISVFSGGLECFLTEEKTLPDAAIVAVGVDSLASVTRKLIHSGVKRILVEKPGALSFSDLCKLRKEANEYNVEIVIGYNRRMYSSVSTAKNFIEKDGGIQSMHFEFTEWSHVIESLATDQSIKSKWLLANSTHLIDLAFFLGGKPVSLHTTNTGRLSWHPNAAIFVGSGLTESNVAFSYHANWDAPGRWNLELLTRQHRLLLSPMETLQVMKRGSVLVEQIEIDDINDSVYKPGLYRQVVSFLHNDKNVGLCSLEEHLELWPIYEKIAGYITE